MKIRIVSLNDVRVLARLNRTVQVIHAEAVPKLFRGDASLETIEAEFLKLIRVPMSFG